MGTASSMARGELRPALTIWFMRVVALAAAVLGTACDRRSEELPSAVGSSHAGANAARSLEGRLFDGLSERRCWATSAVKIHLKRPTVSKVLSTKDGRSVVVDAWPSNENDFSVAMMRLDDGDTLYAITDQEWNELRAR